MYQPSTFDPPWITFFHRPCPSWIQKHQGTFQFFPALPKELQLIIWDYAVAGEHGQVVIFHNSDPAPEHNENNPGFYAQGIMYKPPSLLHVSFDARRAALKVYETAFSLELGYPIYFDFNKDILYFKHLEALTAFCSSTADASTDLDRVTMVFFEPPKQTRNRDLFHICRRFSGLKSLFLREADPTVGNPPTSPIRHISPARFRAHLPITLSRILAAQQDRKLDTSQYQPPIIHIGTKSQWKAMEQRRQAERENHMDWEITG